MLQNEHEVDPLGSLRGRYLVRYYILAVLFMVFEAEAIFLFPWVVKFKALGWFGLIEVLIFSGILVAGYIWIWKTRALEWV